MLGRIPEVKQATRPRVSPGSPLLYRPEGKEVSAWKWWEEGHGGCCQPSLGPFGKWAFELQGHSWLSKSIIMCSAFNKNISPRFTESWTLSLRLSIPSLYSVPKPHFRIVKRSILDPCPVSCPRAPKTLGFYCLSVRNEISGGWGLSVCACLDPEHGIRCLEG